MGAQEHCVVLACVGRRIGVDGVVLPKPHSLVGVGVALILARGFVGV